MTEDAERQEKLTELSRLKASGEKAYGDMYDAPGFKVGDDCYREAKDCFDEAIALAHRLGLTDEVNALNERLQHIKKVYRSQFSH